MPLSARKLRIEIKASNCTVEPTAGGHYLVLDPDGNPICGFAINHKRGGKRGEVLDVYVKAVRNALAKLSSKGE